MLNDRCSLPHTTAFATTAARLARVVNRVPAVVSVALLLAVTEMTATGVVPVAGVRVEAQSSRRSVITDATGVYSPSGAYGADNLVSTIKPRHVPFRRTVTMSGDTRLHIRVDRMQSDVLVGEVFEGTEAGRVPVEGVELSCDGGQQ